MPSAEQTAEFIKASFRSAWTMELMCFLMKNQERTHTHREMIDELQQGFDSRNAAARDVEH